MSSQQTLTEFLIDYWSKSTQDFAMRATFSAVLTMFLDYTGTSVAALFIYFAISVCDLALGVWVAVVFKRFSTHKLNNWLRKIITQLFIILLAASIFKMLFYSTTLEWQITNFLLTMFVITDSTSILTKLLQLGAPVPPVVNVLVGAARKRVAAHVGELLHDDEVREHLEKALEKHNEQRDCEIIDNCGPSGDDVGTHADGREKDR